MASQTQRTWFWVDSGSWWWTGRPGMLWFMGSQRVGHDWATELNWTITSSSELQQPPCTHHVAQRYTAHPLTAFVLSTKNVSFPSLPGESYTPWFFLNTQTFTEANTLLMPGMLFFIPFLLLFLVNFHICIRPQTRCCFFGESIITRISKMSSSTRVFLLSYTMSYIPMKLTSFPYKIVSFLRAW